MIKDEPSQILRAAIEKYKPVKVLLMLSGGHDSVTNAHVCANLLISWSIPFEVYHGDTTIGIPETQDYVQKICAQYGWKLNIRKPPKIEDHYDSIVKKYGFPGPTKSSHRYMYIRLKERALRRFVTHECKSDPRARDNVLLCSGVRRQESQIRMGYAHVMTKDNSRCWVNPIFYWSEEACRSYMHQHNIPRNPVKDLMCISGECLCGAWAKKEEWIELQIHFPAVAAKINALRILAAENGHPWGWASGPKEWAAAEAAKRQLSFNFMCAGCEMKKEVHV